MKVAKGRIEEAAGALTNDDKLRVKGQTDQTVGHVIQAGEKGIRQANKAAQKIVTEAQDKAQAAVENVQKRKK